MTENDSYFDSQEVRCRPGIIPSTNNDQCKVHVFRGQPEHYPKSQAVFKSQPQLLTNRLFFYQRLE